MSESESILSCFSSVFYTLLEEIFKHELTALPSSLFDDSGFMRGSSKHLLAKHLWDASEGCKQEMLKPKMLTISLMVAL